VQGLRLLSDGSPGHAPASGSNMTPDSEPGVAAPLGASSSPSIRPGGSRDGWESGGGPMGLPASTPPAHASATAPSAATPAPGDVGDVSYLARSAFVVLAIVALTFSFSVVVVTRLQHRAAQTRAFNRLRDELALGVAPTGQVDDKGHLLAPGSPVALLEIPAIHMHEVVLEGSTPAVLTSGPGHLRNTVLPGQEGTSVVLGRRAGFGGPFGSLHRLRPGDKITVTTGIGTSHFTVSQLRRAGDPAPPPTAAGHGRLTLVTATGAPFVPSGVLRVDADLQGSAQTASRLVLTSVPPSEQPMGTDSSNLWVLVFLLQVLVVLTVCAVWSWRRWGRAQTWIVFFPAMLLVVFYLTSEVTRLLPNLL